MPPRTNPRTGSAAALALDWARAVPVVLIAVLVRPAAHGRTTAWMAADGPMTVGAVLPMLANHPGDGAHVSLPTAPPTASARPLPVASSTPTSVASVIPAASATLPSPTRSPAPSPEPTATLGDGCRQGLADPGFEDVAAWAVSSESGRPVREPGAARTGRVGLRLGGTSGIDAAEGVAGVPALPERSGRVHLTLWLRRRTAADPAGPAGDYLTIAVRGDVPEAIEPVLSLTDIDPPPDGASGWSPDGWHRLSIDVSEAFRAREDFASAALLFVMVPDGDARSTVFDIDDASLEVCP